MVSEPLLTIMGPPEGTCERQSHFECVGDSLSGQLGPGIVDLPRGELHSGCYRSYRDHWSSRIMLALEIRYDPGSLGYIAKRESIHCTRELDVSHNPNQQQAMSRPNKPKPNLAIAAPCLKKTIRMQSWNSFSTHSQHGHSGSGPPSPPANPRRKEWSHDGVFSIEQKSRSLSIAPRR